MRFVLSNLNYQRKIFKLRLLFGIIYFVLFNVSGPVSILEIENNFEIEKSYKEYDIKNISRKYSGKEALLNKETTSLSYNASTSKNDTLHSNSSQIICQCLNYSSLEVQLVTSNDLLNFLKIENINSSHTTPSVCYLVLFYAKWCHISAKTAPFYNALAKAFPDIHMLAIDVVGNYNFVSRFGIIAVPTILLFHNGRPRAKFNESSITLENLASFLTHHTGMNPVVTLNVTSAHFFGPVQSTVSPVIDIWLYISWIFLVYAFLYYLIRTTLFKKVSESLRLAWLEAENEHEHAE